MSEVEIVTADQSSLADQLVSAMPEDKKKTKRSWVHNYFTVDEASSKLCCTLCRALLTERPDKSTGNLINHVRTKHKDVYDSVSGPHAQKARKMAQQLSLEDTSQIIKKQERLTRDGFLDRLLKFIVTCDLPLRVVEDSALEDLLTYVSKDKEATKLPGRTSITDRLDSKFEAQKQIIKDLIAKVGKINLIIDCWTSSNQQAFQGVICRFIDNQWNLVTMPLDLTLLAGSHTGENIASALLPVVQDYDVQQKLLAITTDNASNMDTFFDSFSKLLEEDGIVFDTTNQRIRCLAHILNLCATCVLDCFENDETAKGSITKLRDGISGIRASPQRRDIYLRNCDTAGKKRNMVILDVKTRWNSCFDMIVRALEMREALDVTLQTIKGLRQFQLQPQHWKSLEILLQLLTPIKEATLMVSKELSPNMASSTMVYQELFEHFEKFRNPVGSSRRNSSNENDPWIPIAASQAIAKLEKYYPETDGKAHVIGTILHPGFKLEWYKQSKWPQEWIKQAQSVINTEWENNYKPKPTLQHTTDKQTDTGDGYFAALYRNKMGGCSKGVTDELKRYLAAGVVNVEVIKKTGLLGWWRDHECEYENLSKMAKDYLAVGGSGVPVERFFASGTDILTDNRQNLSSEHLKKLMVMKSWLKIK